VGRHPIVGIAMSAVALASAAVVGLAGSASATGARPTKAHAASCTVTSATSIKVSKYNKTPKGSGPWHVALDPCNPEGLGLSTPPYYDCAYWAAEKRPDVWTNAVDKYGYAVAPGGAWNVEIDAKRAHYSITHTPKVGDIAAWKPNATMGHTGDGTTYSASPGGHVAYVQKVHGRHITISTMGVSNDGGKTETLVFNTKTFFIHKTRK
jgi:surface antigen